MLNVIMIAAMLNFGTYQTDTYTTRNGNELSFAFFGHASLAIALNDKVIYVDPVSANADFSTMPKANVILITHHHDDHFDIEALKQLVAPNTIIIANNVVASMLGSAAQSMDNGSKKRVNNYLTVEAVAAYNTTEGRDRFHPKGRDNGYILSLGGERIYIAGDTEPTEQMYAVTGIDYAFLPVNQPYTMTVEQAADAVLAIKPRVFYPYHFGQTDQQTDLNRLAKLLTGSPTEMIVRNME